MVAAVGVPVELPVIVTVAVPIAAVALAVSVSTLLPAVGLVPHVAVTPLGRLDATSSTGPVNPYWSVTATVVVPEMPCLMLRTVGLADSVKLAGGLTVSESSVVAVKVPELPMIVRLAVPRLAVALAVSVSTLFPLVGFVPQVAVTPLGRLEMDRLTLPENPPRSYTLMVVLLKEP